MREIDLHVHTNISDGSETPRNGEICRSLGLRAIAVTDHDSINGVAEAQKAGKECGLEVVARDGARLRLVRQRGTHARIRS